MHAPIAPATAPGCRVLSQLDDLAVIGSIIVEANVVTMFAAALIPGLIAVAFPVRTLWLPDILGGDSRRRRE